MAKSPMFVHLRSRSPYSMLEGALKIKDTAKRARSMRMPALALTDTNNMCGALEFSDIMSGEGVQPIMGLTLSLDLEIDDQPGQLRKDPDGTIALLAQNEQGYGNLMKLTSAAFLEVEATDLPHVKSARLEDLTEGVIALTGGPDGALNKLICQGRHEEAEKWLDHLAAIYPQRLYIELQRHDLPHEIEAEKVLIDWAYAKDLPLVATNEPYFIDPDIYEPHDALLAMNEGSYILEKDRRKLTRQHYFKSSEEMATLFKDIPEAIENTLDIATRCSFKSHKRAPILPNFGDGSLSEGDILAQQARDGLKARLEKIELSATEKDYYDRLDFEIGIIRKMGFPGYFLIVSDFIKWAKEQGIPVGPGRGSGAGSVVAWALLITDLDPLKYGLLFERFLNPERVSMPDFDIDFCQERRGEVIKYVQEKYGEDQVAHIITFGTLQARAVVRDVGRVMQMPLGQVDRLAKLVPSNPANPVTLSEAIQMEKGLREAQAEDPAVRRLLNTALKLEGLYRNASTHAAGVVIGDRPLTELVPLYRDPRSDIPATQFTMKWAEKAGLVKFDFLGLKTLTVIDRCIKYLAKQGIELDIDAVSTTTPEAYKPLADGLSAGVFQLESSGMRDVLRKMAPDSIEELTALISLYRPGPMKNIPMYIDRKYGRAEIEYPHESLKEILEETYGVIIYQEQVMQIAQVLSGYSLGEADMLRRAMGKKDQAEMDRQRSRFGRLILPMSKSSRSRGGAFDCLEPNRAKSLASASILQSIGSRAAQEKASAQNSLFGDAPETMAEPDLPNPQPWSNVEQLDHELGAIGFYLGGHPLETFLPVLERKKATMAADIEDRFKAGGRNMRLAGVVRKRQERMSKRGKRFAWVNISDPTGEFEAFFGEELLAVNRGILEAGALIELTAEAKDREGEISLFASTVTSLELTGEASMIKGLQIRLRSATIETLDELEKTLETLKSAPAKTQGYVEIFAPLDGAREGHWRLPGKWGIDASIQKAIKANRSVETITEIAA